jgi:thiol-disulfide isomerase/thioredoxin
MPRARFNLVMIGTLVTALLVTVVLYERKGDWSKPAPYSLQQTSQAANQTAEPDPCQTSSTLASVIDPLAKGEIAALQRSKKPMLMPDLKMEVVGGTQNLSAFWGKVVLLNLWATWCVPCREEMPALNQLQSQLGGADFSVVALNMDTRNLDKVPQWLDANGITALTRYMDPGGKAFQTLRGMGKVSGLPTTFLIDRKGCLIAEMAGPANWSSEDALTLLRTAIQSR